MKRTATYLMSAALGTMVLATSTAAYAQMELPLAALGAALLAKTGALPAPSPAPLMTGRSVATGQTGNFCSTPVKTCELRRAASVGVGCSCHVPGGRARGSVTP